MPAVFRDTIEIEFLYVLCLPPIFTIYYRLLQIYINHRTYPKMLHYTKQFANIYTLYIHINLHHLRLTSYHHPHCYLYFVIISILPFANLLSLVHNNMINLSKGYIHIHMAKSDLLLHFLNILIKYLKLYFFIFFHSITLIICFLFTFLHILCLFDFLKLKLIPISFYQLEFLYHIQVAQARQLIVQP